MKPARRALLLMATIQEMIETVQTLTSESDLDEVMEALQTAGLNAEDLLQNYTFFEAIQRVCSEFAAIHVTQAEMNEIIDEENSITLS
ncbi:hypothetical protein [Paenibacillus sp. P32E]|uniref:hypothetical protein n=1 Tax=Paenibacillus sp. P32E TaxID=1349434 RepID=UPI00093FDF67|nr:hypothetical protein [Paenibacillus sp. P32E]OKP93698.1 hypothetical protein A3848_04100 [Paenibacillus sp. P32E]